MATDINSINADTTLTMNDVGSLENYAKGLNASENALVSDYTKAIASQAKPLDIYTGLEETAGIPKLRNTANTLSQQVYNLEDTIRRVDQNVANTTKNSYVTQGQQSGMIEARKQPLQENLSYLSTGLGRVEDSITKQMADINNRMGYIMAGQEKDLMPYQIQLQVMQDQNARSMTGYSTDMQNRLTLLMDKLNRERYLSDREWEEASQLRIMEQQYEMAKQDQGGGDVPTQVIDVGGSKKLINTQTGDIISSYGGGGSSSSNLSNYLNYANGQDINGNYTYNGYNLSSYLFGD